MQCAWTDGITSPQPSEPWRHSKYSVSGYSSLIQQGCIHTPDTRKQKRDSGRYSRYSRYTTCVDTARGRDSD
eukprot:6303800-Prymnesium_polylepis.1